MAASYFESTQHEYWECSKDELEDARQQDRDETVEKQYPLPDRRIVFYFIQQQIAKLGRRMNIRQVVQATAQVFVARFYNKVDMRRTNPYLLLTTAFYLACKIEECPHHIRIVVMEARNLWPDYIQADTARLGECEFYLLSEMNSQIIVHHPYNTLTKLQGILSLSTEDFANAWAIVNDSYVTDLPFLYPPHITAIVAVTMALTLKPPYSAAAAQQPGHMAAPMTATGQEQVTNLRSWLAKSQVDIGNLINATQTLVSWYVLVETYDEKSCKEALARYIKGRGLDQ